MKGTVKWFNASKGYGFIQPDGGGDDVLLHAKELRRVGATAPGEGDRIEFEVAEVAGKGKRAVLGECTRCPTCGGVMLKQEAA